MTPSFHFPSFLNYSLLYCNGDKLKRRNVFIVIAVVSVSITLFVFFFGTRTYEVPSFTVPSQRVDTGKSAAITEKWDGIGKIVDMIWE